MFHCMPCLYHLDNFGVSRILWVVFASPKILENYLDNVSLYIMPLSLEHFWSCWSVSSFTKYYEWFLQVPKLQNIGKFAFIYGKAKSNLILAMNMDYGCPERKLPSLKGRKSTPTAKFLGTAEAYFVCHIDPNFQISLIYAFIGCP